MTSATDQDQVAQLIGQFVMLVQPSHIAKRAKRDQVMHIMFAVRRFGCATLFTPVMVARADTLALFLPVWPVVVDRVIPLAGLFQGGLGFRQDMEPITACLHNLWRVVQRQHAEIFMRKTFDAPKTNNLGADL